MSEQTQFRIRVLFENRGILPVQVDIKTEKGEEVAAETRRLANQYAAVLGVTAFEMPAGPKHVFNAQGDYEYTISLDACKHLKITG